MSSRRVSSIAGNNMEIKRKNEVLSNLGGNAMIVCELVESIWVKGNFNEAIGLHCFRLHKTALGTISSFSLIFFSL